MLRQLICSIFLLLLLHNAIAQYITNANATTINCHCYQLTDAANNQAGSVWNSNKINLTQPFNYSFDVYYGCADANGADGISFILQPVSTSIGSTGGGLGFSGITPSVGVLMDTYQNTSEGDPTYDHISINTNGNVSHTTATNLAGPVTIIDGNDNAEDCAWHVVKIVWEPTTLNLAAYVDGVLRVQTALDMTNTIFGGNPNVYWGFSASTGGLNNVQKFCTRLNGTINNTIINNATCLGQPVTFVGMVDAFIPISSYYWDFGDNTTATQQNPPPHNYTTAGTYNVKFAINAIDGCTSDTAYQTVIIGAYPIATFTVNNACQSNSVILNSTATITATTTIANYGWLVDGQVLANQQQINTSTMGVGSHTVKHFVTSSVGCVSDTAYGSFVVYPKPTTAFTVNDTCEAKPTILQTINSNATLQYSWYIDGTFIANATTITNIYAVGTHTVKHYATSTDDCVSDTSYGTFNVYAIPNAAILYNDTCIGRPVTLSTNTNSPNISYKWLVDGVPVATTQTYTSSSYTIGVHIAQLIITNFGKCSNSSSQTFTIYNKPNISGTATAVCINQPTIFTANLLNPPFATIQYNWLFADGTTMVGQSISKTFANPIASAVKLYTTNNGTCNSDTIIVPFTVTKAIAFAGNDTTVVQNQPFLLNGSSNGITNSWQPAIYFNNNTLLNPTGTLAADQLFTLTTTTAQGCIGTSTVLVKVFTGSAIYVPNVFTPNADGKNDILIPLYIGIKELSYFNIYNRWGQLIFSTNNLTKGWNALYKGTPQPVTNYIWVIKATDYLGKVYTLKGNALLIR